MNSLLFIMVEGNDDERFFNKVICPLLEEDYKNIKIWQHAQKSRETVEKMFLSMEDLEADYIYVEDLDHEKNIAAKKTIILNKVDYINKERIVIVVKEIESWYLAGINQEDASLMKIPYIENTENIFKEDFNSMVHKSQYDSRINLMQKLLKCFSVQAALQKNSSFALFHENFIEDKR